MRIENENTAEASRAEARRAQIRAAAAECFRQHGFHGTSIARISQEAGMSPGHIYHYFENKEAIIADIVAEDLKRLLEMTAGWRAAADVKSAMVECAVQGVAENLDPGIAALQLEIVAEAARNPHIADIVRAADQQCRRSLTETLRALRLADGRADDEARIAGMVETLAAMFEGLRVRVVRNPDLDGEAVARTFRSVILHLLSEP